MLSVGEADYVLTLLKACRDMRDRTSYLIYGDKDEDIVPESGSGDLLEAVKSSVPQEPKKGEPGHSDGKPDKGDDKVEMVVVNFNEFKKKQLEAEKEKEKEKVKEENKEPVFKKEHPMKGSGTSLLGLEIVNVAKVSLKVFILTSEYKAMQRPVKQPLTIHVPASAKVAATIEVIVKENNRDKNRPRLEQEPSAYLLRMAESNGTPDLDPVQPTQGLKGLGEFLCLLDTQTQNKKSNSQRRISIRLPRQQSTQVAMSEGETLMRLLRRVTNRWQLDYLEHSFYLPGEKEPLPLTYTFEDLPSPNLELRGKTTAPPTFDPVKLDSSPMALARDQHFIITKSGTFRSKQEHYLRINKDDLTKWRRDKSGSNKGPWRRMCDIREAIVSTTNPKQFTLIFDKQSSTFEAANESEANEIVTKINKIRARWYNDK